MIVLISSTLHFKLECAIKAIHNGLPAAAGGGIDNATTRGASNSKSKTLAKAPCKLNKVTGKESTAFHAFSQQNWGGVTASYYRSIANRTSDVLCEIVTDARDWAVVQGTSTGAADEVPVADEAELDA